MKIIDEDLRHGSIKLKVETPDDLWYLSSIIEPGDFVKGKTLRKVTKKDKSSEDKSGSIQKKPVYLEIKAEKIELSDTDILRVLGTITQGPDDVPRGEHHSFNLEEGSIFTITKGQWLKYQIDRLKEASHEESSNILVVLFDRDSAIFSRIKKDRAEILAEFSGDVEKKGIEQKVTSNFYKEIISQIDVYRQKHGFTTIIVASPAFWKEELMKELKGNELKKHIILSSCSAVGKSGLNEVLKRPELEQALKQDRFSKEINAVESLLMQISKDNLAVYGYEQTKAAIKMGATKTVLLTTKFITKTREKNKYFELEWLLKETERHKGNIMIINSEHDGGKKLDGLGGIGALLRFKFNY